MIELLENKLVEVCQIFDNVKCFRDALHNYTIAWGFDYKLLKNELQRVKAWCTKENCAWQISTTLIGECGTFCIKSFNNVHTCGGGIGTTGHPKASRRWIANIVEDKLKRGPLYKASDLMNDISNE